MSSIVSFAVPMMFGILSGCYSTTFLCTPLWVLWVEHTQKKEAEKKVLHKHAKKA
jgi:preprotein translocase subunit SecF